MPLATHASLIALGSRPLATAHGPFEAHVFANVMTRELALALSRGPIEGRDPVLARVHSSCVTSESYGGRDCDCAEQLDGALEAIDAEGRGVLFYLMQEGRGAGFCAKARDLMLVQASAHRLTTFEAYSGMGLDADYRAYAEVASMCELL